ncbi:unnamed protein product [Schistocephalus solidus]|uniref:Ricin B-type lectin domain-containing protein n=1 Tax=Schistocephalus solidus TaxID=70667 RepID=A0A183TE43_SCHSO|nr:unnamed protein product [Schistocephalus solidus]
MLKAAQPPCRLVKPPTCTQTPYIGVDCLLNGDTLVTLNPNQLLAGTSGRSDPSWLKGTLVSQLCDGDEASFVNNERQPLAAFEAGC